nr:retrovirus-related Pol polyprotein from transposon TNT 1-94 [Tanacetum cinerariifolium]
MQGSSGPNGMQGFSPVGIQGGTGPVGNGWDPRMVYGQYRTYGPATCFSDVIATKRNKTDLEEQSQDDLFNSLKIYEAEVKSSSSASTSTQYIAFVSSFNTDSTNEPVSAAASVSAIDVDDLEEIDLKWQMAMLTVRARQFLQRTGRNLGANGPTSMGFDMSKVECYNFHRKGHFARKCRSLKDTRKNGLKSVKARLLVYQQNETIFEDGIKLLKLKVQLRDNALVVLRMQKLISQLEILRESLSQEDINLKFLRSLPTEWRTHTLIWRNKTDLEEQSQDDLFNSLKIYEVEVKSSSSASTSTQYIAFVSSFNTNSTNEPVSAAASVSAIDVDDLAEIDLKWQMAMLTVRARQFLQRTGRNLGANRPTSMGFDMSKAEEEATNYALMAFTSSSSSSSDNEEVSCSKVYTKAYATLQSHYDKLTDDFRKSQFDVISYKTGLESVEARLLVYQQNETIFEDGDGHHDAPPPYTGTFMPPKPDLVFHDAPNVTETAHTAFNVELSSTKPDKDLSHTHRPSAPIIEDWVYDSEDDSDAEISQNAPIILKPKSNGNRKNRKTYFVCKSLDHLIKDCDFYDKKMAQTSVRNHAHRGNHQHYASMTLTNPQKHVVPTAVLTKSKLVPITAARPVIAAVLKSHVTRPRPANSIITKPYSPPRRHIDSSPSSKASNLPPKVMAVKVPQVNAAKGVQGKWEWKPKCLILDHVSCHTSASITLRRLITMMHLGDPRNMSYLSDFEDLNGGYVSFSGNPKGGKISGKGKIKTGKLDFDDVYSVKELKFNLFSVSQMCDKKNSVLFTDTECLVLSFEFKLPDENQVLLRVPRENNMYNVNLKNIVPCGDLTCLFGKATLDEMKGIKKEFSVPKTPQQNGIAEKKNKTLIEAARTMLAYSLLPISFWAEAVNTACYVQNKTMNYQPVTASNQSNPSAGVQEQFDTKKAGEESVQQFVLFPVWSSGSTNPHNTDRDVAFEVKEPEFERRKPQSEVHVSLSSSDQTKKYDDKTKREAKGKSHVESLTGYRNLSAEFEDFSDNIINEVNDVDSSFLVVGQISTNSTNTFSATSPSNATNWKTLLILVMKIMLIHNDDFHTCMFACFLSQEEPKRVNQALKDSSWIEAMQVELLQFKMQKVWVLVDFPHGKRAIGTKRVFRNKKDKRGIVVRNKARLVTQGHTQEEVIDYEEVFAPVARIEAIRLFLAYASFMGFMVYQMNVKSAFLYGTIKEEVYVCQPPRFEDPDYPDKFSEGKDRPDIGIKRQNGDILLVHIYVDDIIFGSTITVLCKAFEKLMKDKFQMSLMGELTFFLGLQVKQKKDGIFISQDKYVVEILRKFGLTNRKSASTLIDTEKPLLKDLDGEDVDVHTYRSKIGSLMYITS